MAPDLVFFDREDGDKIADTVRQFARDHKGDIGGTEDFRGVGRSVSVLLTGPADPSNSGMYPGTFVSWRPGPLDDDDLPVVGSDTSSFLEVTEHWSADKNEDGEVPDTCWVIISNLELDGIPDDPSTEVIIVDGTVVGEHPLTGVPIVLRSYRDGDSGSGSTDCCSELTTPVIADLCVVRDPKTGLLRDVRYVQHDLSTKDEACVTAEDCPADGCTSGSGDGLPTDGCAEIACLEDVVQAIADHEGSSDPHPQYPVFTMSATEPAGPQDGDMWFDTDEEA